MSLARKNFPSINLNEIMLQNFEGKEVDRILGVDTLFGCLIFYVIFKNDDKPYRLSYAADFNVAFPAQVIKFYEGRINWLEDLDSEEVQERKAIEALERRFLKDHNIVYLDKNGEIKVHSDTNINIAKEQGDGPEEMHKSQENDNKTGDIDNNDTEMKKDILALYYSDTTEDLLTNATDSVQEDENLDDLIDLKSKKPSLPLLSPPLPLSRKKSILIPFQEEKRKKRKYVKKSDRVRDQSESLKLNGTDTYKKTKNSLKSKLNTVYSTFDTEIVNQPSTSAASSASKPNPFRKIDPFPNLTKYLKDIQKNPSTSSSSKTSRSSTKIDTDGKGNDNDKNDYSTTKTTTTSTTENEKSSTFSFDPDMLIYDDSSDDDYSNSKSKRQNSWN